MKYLEHNLPKGYHLKVTHLHDGNSWGLSRKMVASQVGGTGRKYVTIAKILGADNEELSVGVASCGPNDNPCRAIGREVAVGRAMRGLFGPRHGERSEP